ncbi:MAG: amidohydrolase family protein [Bacteroidia bacterium]|nr:amidohydrolase family protein [Bacteroidia bacterium]
MKPALLIQNGLIFSGKAEEKAEVMHIFIENGVVKSISRELPQVPDGTQIIEAAGKWVMPGFIDSHTHYDAEIIASPGLKESARHGVTTVILGSCSVSAIYNNPENTSDCFTRVEAIPREIMLPLLEKEKSWQNAREWVDYLEKLPLGVNVSSFVGHSDLRSRVMGMERSVKDREKATPEEEKEMDRLLNEALDAGLLGLSTMDNPWDKLDGDKFWSKKTPSYYASWKERKPLLRTLRRRKAILQGAPNLVTRVNALRYMAASTGLFRPTLKTTMIALMDLMADRYIFGAVSLAARIANLLFKGDFRMQSPPAPFTVYYDGVDSVMFEEFPSGQALRHLAKNLDQRNELITDPQFRKEFKAEMRKKFAPKVWHRDLSKAIILKCPDSSLIGRNFYEIAEEKGQNPGDLFLDLIVQYDKKIRWTTTIANDRKEKYPSIYNHPSNLISFSDAGAHLGNMAFYNFPLQMIKNVQESIQKGNPIMSMERCIWRLTGEQADWFGLDCGYLQAGKAADLVILDPKYLDQVRDDEVSEDAVAEFDGYVRLVNRNPEVISQVLVGGEMIYEKGEFVAGYGKEKKFGRFLRSSEVLVAG